MTDAAKQKIVKPHKLECEVPPHSLALLIQRDGEHHHVAPDAQCDVAPRGIPVRKMTVLVGEYRAERALFEAVDQSHAQNQNAVRDVTPSLAGAAAFVDSHLRSRCDPDLVHRPRADTLGDIACELPECWRFGLLERAARIFARHLDKQRLHHLENGHHRGNTKERDELDWYLANHHEAVDDPSGSADNEDDDEGKREIVVRAGTINKCAIDSP